MRIKKIASIKNTMEKTKPCNSCGSTKPIGEFSKGRAVCKSCRSASQNTFNKRKRLKQNTPDVDLQKNYFIKKVSSFSEYLESHPNAGIEYIASQLQELGETYEKLLEQMSVMYFPIRLSEDLLTYLEQLDDLNYQPSPATAMEVLMRTPEEIFIETFGVSNNDLADKIEDELDDLKFIIDAIINTNNVMIDDHNRKIAHKLSAKERFEYIEADVSLDISVPAITFNNLFHLSQKEMVDKIKEIEESQNIWIKAFVKNGYFTKFWNILDSL